MIKEGNMFGYLIQKDSVVVKEGSKDILEANGYKICESEAQAKAKGDNALFKILREEWNRVTDYTTDRAEQLERLMYKDLSDHTEEYFPNMYVIKKLQEELKTVTDKDRKRKIEERLAELEK